VVPVGIGEQLVSGVDAVRAGRRDECRIDWKGHEAAAGTVAWLAAYRVRVGEMAGGLAHAKVAV
jgi:hypothetical protein